jgi:hypothetical protein
MESRIFLENSESIKFRNLKKIESRKFIKAKKKRIKKNQKIKNRIQKI